MSQAEAARWVGITTQRYHDAETDRLAEREIWKIRGRAIYDGNLLAPSTAELCALARRRSRLTLTVVCEELGVSRVTYLERERAATLDIVGYWKDKGFIF